MFWELSAKFQMEKRMHFIMLNARNHFFKLLPNAFPHLDPKQPSKIKFLKNSTWKEKEDQNSDQQNMK